MVALFKLSFQVLILSLLFSLGTIRAQTLLPTFVKDQIEEKISNLIASQYGFLNPSNISVDEITIDSISHDESPCAFEAGEVYSEVSKLSSWKILAKIEFQTPNQSNRIKATGFVTKQHPSTITSEMPTICKLPQQLYNTKNVIFNSAIEEPKQPDLPYYVTLSQDTLSLPSVKHVVLTKSVDASVIPTNQLGYYSDHLADMVLRVLSNETGLIDSSWINKGNNWNNDMIFFQKNFPTQALKVTPLIAYDPYQNLYLLYAFVIDAIAVDKEGLRTFIDPPSSGVPAIDKKSFYTKNPDIIESGIHYDNEKKQYRFLHPTFGRIIRDKTPIKRELLLKELQREDAPQDGVSIFQIER